MITEILEFLNISYDDYLKIKKAFDLFYKIPLIISAVVVMILIYLHWFKWEYLPLLFIISFVAYTFIWFFFIGKNENTFHKEE